MYNPELTFSTKVTILCKVGSLPPTSPGLNIKNLKPGAHRSMNFFLDSWPNLNHQNSFRNSMHVQEGAGLPSEVGENMIHSCNSWVTRLLTGFMLDNRITLSQSCLTLYEGLVFNSLAMMNNLQKQLLKNQGAYLYTNIDSDAPNTSGNT